MNTETRKHTAIVARQIHCSTCNEIWQEKFLDGVSLNLWIAHVKSIRCPFCESAYGRLAFVIG